MAAGLPWNGTIAILIPNIIAYFTQTRHFMDYFSDSPKASKCLSYTTMVTNRGVQLWSLSFFQIPYDMCSRSFYWRMLTFIFLVYLLVWSPLLFIMVRGMTSCILWGGRNLCSLFYSTVLRLWGTLACSPAVFACRALRLSQRSRSDYFSLLLVSSSALCLSH